MRVAARRTEPMSRPYSAGVYLRRAAREAGWFVPALASTAAG
jgi:hypothetical protein